MLIDRQKEVPAHDIVLLNTSTVDTMCCSIGWSSTAKKTIRTKVKGGNTAQLLMCCHSIYGHDVVLM